MGSIKGKEEFNRQLDDAELHKDMSEGARKKYFRIRAAMKLTGRLASFLPERVTYALCVGIAMLGYRLVPKYRELARRHLEIAFGEEKSPKEIDSILKQTYRNQGCNLAEFLMIPHKSADWINSKIKFHDPKDNLKKELDKGKGVVAVGGHIGNIELVCAWLGVNKVPMVTVVKAQRDELFTKFVMEVRRKWGSELIFRAQGVKDECMRQLEKNKMIGLVADQNAASGGVFVDFFGRKAATVVGPAVIAMQAGLPILPGFMTSRNPDRTMTLYMLDPIPMRDSGDRKADVLYNVQQYTSALENFIREHPSEYLWWHQRWKTRPDDEDSGQ